MERPAGRPALPRQAVIFVAPQKRSFRHVLDLRKYYPTVFSIVFCLSLFLFSTTYTEGKEVGDQTEAVIATQPDQTFQEIDTSTRAQVQPTPTETPPPPQTQLQVSQPSTIVPQSIQQATLPIPQTQPTVVGIAPPLASYTSVSTYFSSYHPGVDLTDPAGTPIMAVDDGIVREAGWSNVGYGNVVIIDHSSGMSTLYAHLSQIGVSTTTSVKRGQIIGLVGCTGNCTGNHLHFEIHLGDRAVNPFLYL